jgi:hypothetical protein
MEEPTKKAKKSTGKTASVPCIAYFVTTSSINRMLRGPLSRIALLIIGISWFYGIFKADIWKRDKFIEGDGLSYYVYLPMCFIKHDPKLLFLEKEQHTYYDNLWYSISPTGIKHTKMGAGLALMQAPFFLLAHVFAKISNWKADGFSPPYALMLCIATVFYAYRGISLLRKRLLHYFGDATTALVLLLIAFGTNLNYYVLYEPFMSHAYSFFLFAWLIDVSIQWYEEPSKQSAWKLGLVAGLIALTRLPNAIVLLLPLLYGVNNWQEFKRSIGRWFTNYYILYALLPALCIYGIQLAYYQIVSGSLFYYSYQQERFFFASPHILEGLFGFRKGWFIYTPLMFAAFAGLLFLKRKAKKFFLPLMIYLPFSIYVVLSWWCWWYGGSYGMRALIENYAILAFPLAALIDWLLERRFRLALTSWIIGLGVIWLSLFQTEQYKKQLITYDSMTFKAYKAVFLHRHAPINFNELLEYPDYDRAKFENKP